MKNKIMSEQQSVIPVIFILAIAGAIGLAVYFALNPAPQEQQVQQSEITTPDMTDSIRVDSPRPNQQISSPVIIEGQARGIWFFEASFPVRLVDANENTLAQGIAETGSDWMTTDFVPFQAELKFDAGNSKTGFLILQRDNPSGLKENDYSVKIPVTFRQDMIKVQVFFSNSIYDPDSLFGKVYPVERQVPKTRAVARAAVEELLKGPSDKEKSEGYFTNINQGVKIQKLSIENGIARVDFDKQIEYQLGGSTRVGAIRAQITETLKQFSTVNEVIISVDGRVEDAIQP